MDRFDDGHLDVHSDPDSLSASDLLHSSPKLFSLHGHGMAGIPAGDVGQLLSGRIGLRLCHVLRQGIKNIYTYIRLEMKMISNLTIFNFSLF